MDNDDRLRRAPVRRAILAALAASAAVALVGAGTPNIERAALSQEQLLALLRSASDQQQAFAVYQLAARGWVSTTLLAAQTKDEHPDVRRAAVFAIALTADTTALPLFEAALKDSFYGVRRAAIIGIGNLKGADAARIARAALGDNDPAVRELAVLACGRLDDRSAAPLLIKMLTDPSERVARTAAMMLGRFGDASVVEPLKQALASAKKRYPSEAAKTLTKAVEQRRNFAYNFSTLADLLRQIAEMHGLDVRVNDEVLFALYRKADDPDNLDAVKLSMWNVSGRKVFDDLARLSGAVWYVDDGIVNFAGPGYAERDTPFELEAAGALLRLGDRSAEDILRRYQRDKRWGWRAKELLGAGR